MKVLSVRLIVATVIWVFLSLVITNRDLFQVFTLFGTMALLGGIYGYNVRVILIRRLKKTNALQIILGMIIASIIAHLISATIIYPGCYLLLANGYEPIICIARRGQIFDTLIISAFSTFFGACFVSFLYRHNKVTEN